MTLRVIEGFDWLPGGLSQSAVEVIYSANAMYWTASGAALQPRLYPAAGRFGGTALAFNFGFSFTGVAGATFTYVTPTGVSVSSGVYGLAINRNENSSNPIFGVFDAANAAPQFTVEFCQYGVIKVWRGYPVSGTLLVTTPIAQFLNNTWFYAEVGFTISPTVGSILVKINAGVPSHETGIVINLTGVNTQNTSSVICDSIFWGGAQSADGAGWFMSFDDMYFVDTAGSVNNTFLGNVRVQFLLTNGAGAHTGLSIGGSSPAATNWQSVHDLTLDEAQYVYTATTGVYDLYTISPMVNTGPVFGVQVRGAMRQDDATEIEGQNLLYSSGTQGTTTPRLLSETENYYKDIIELDPHTGVGWLAAGVNAAQIGVEKAA